MKFFKIKKKSKEAHVKLKPPGFIGHIVYGIDPELFNAKIETVFELLKNKDNEVSQELINRCKRILNYLGHIPWYKDENELKRIITDYDICIDSVLSELTKNN